MASFPGIQRQGLTSGSSIITLLNLCEESGRTLAILKDRERVFSGAIDELAKLMREREEPMIPPSTHPISEPVARLSVSTAVPAEVADHEEFSGGEEATEFDGAA